jgi:predicted ArsR family transcriptional regulator
MQTSDKLNVNEWPEIRKVKVSNKIGWMYFAEMAKTVMSELGEEQGGELIKSWAEKVALEKILPTMKEMGLDGEDFMEVGAYFQMATAAIGYDTELDRLENGDVSFKLHRPCIWFPGHEDEISPALCQALCNCERTVAKTLNPNTEVELVRNMALGDEMCELIFSSKE